MDQRREALENALLRAARSGGLTRDAARSVAADVCRLDSGGGEMAVKEMLGRLGARDQERVRRIVAALRRLDGGQYGTCERCGAAIDAARLDLMPETTTCRSCAD